jgi:peptidoglycan/LPS O-acetylase OafA/YrhL
MRHLSRKAGDGAAGGTVNFSENNLDCLRLILASVVVLVHSYGLTELQAFSVFDRDLSAVVAVRAFFVISGLLIYRSYTRSSSIRSYLEKRVRRIYPAYFTIVVLAAISLWTLSTLPVSQYFGVGFWKYLGANLVFLNFLAPTLPGVFSSNVEPFVNGALWTLKIEVAFYLLVPAIHYLCRRFGTNKIIGAIVCLSCAWRYGFAGLDIWATSRGAAPVYGSHNIYWKLENQLPAQLIYFCAGILLLHYFDTLKQHFRAIFGVSAGLFVLDNLFTGGVLDVLWISGLVFCFGFWRYFGNFSKYGDFSYGVYIVHCPILQTLIVFGLARLNPATFLAIGLSLVFLASALMWYLVESRFLASSSHYREGLLKKPA